MSDVWIINKEKEREREREGGICLNINIITLLYIKTLISKESNKMRIYYSYRCRDTWTEYFYNETIDLSGLRSGLSILSLP